MCIAAVEMQSVLTPKEATRALVMKVLLGMELYASTVMLLAMQLANNYHFQNVFCNLHSWKY